MFHFAKRSEYCAHFADILQEEDLLHLPVEKRTKYRGTFKYGSMFSQPRVASDGRTIVYEDINPPPITYRPWRSAAGQAAQRGFLTSRLQKNDAWDFFNEDTVDVG